MKHLKVVRKGKGFWVVCPYCGERTRLGVYAAAHDHEELVYTCPICDKRSAKLKRACELAEKG